MSSYFFSFRLSEKQSAKGTYNERYKALNDAIKEISSGWWLTTTSFGVFASARSADQVLADVAAVIDESMDLFLLGKIDYLGIWLLGHYTTNDEEVLGSMIKDLHLR